LNNRFYVIGDDANYLLVLDSALQPVDSVSLYQFPEKRIPKNLKADLEGITVIARNKLFVTGSGSAEPYRNTAWLIDPVTRQKDSIRLDTFYRRLQFSGVGELNIEGIASLPGSIILSNRGSKGNPRNFLLFTSRNFYARQAEAPVVAVRVGSSGDSTVFNGVSGMTYTEKGDRLILTVSSENTSNSYDDGEIGKSYLWIIRNISSKKNWKAINPDQVIDLEKMDPRFRRQKIESVCVTKETHRFLHLLLAADNDNGTSSIFRVVVEKK
jgi:hypothetical protein